MTINKILVVDFVNKKVTAGYSGPSNQTFTVLNPPSLSSNKRVIDSIERIDTLMRELKNLDNQTGDEE